MIWWNQTGAASAVATRRVSRSLCCAWKKRGEGRASSKATGTPGSNTLAIVSNQYHFGGSFCLDAGIIRRNASLSRCSAKGGGVGESGSKRRWWRLVQLRGRVSY